jgi:predicted ATPase/DNA-binding winged helix-turn-helix (wHTH) protein
VSGASPKRVYTSGQWEIDLGRRELRAQGVPVSLGGRAFEIIEALVQSAGELVTKDDLMGRVWPGAIIEENTLQVHISAIRKTLGPDRRMLKTASGRGYRLLGSWTIRPESSSEPDALEPVRMPVQPFLTNLPVAASGLIGRTTAEQHLRDLVSAYRAVTLIGPGGIGKTALALEVARSLFPTFQGDVWLVELASLSDTRLVPSAVASVLGLKLGGGEISPESVARAIGGKKLLLVLDNCEHVIDGAARLVETVVQLCPRTTVLATSREVLRIEGEYVYRVSPLDAPPPHQEEPGKILRHSAVQLFIARTRALDSDFSPRGENLPGIAAICRRLDGIPLAIEFAAARAATLGLPQVASRLDDRFGLLTGGRRTALPRHQTLRATLDWSYELLPEPERRLLRRLAIFAAGFTREAATAVMRDTGNGASAVMEGIANLVNKSLVTLDGTAPAGRWRLLETIRAYALEKLAESGEAEHAARRHAEFFRDVFAPASLGSELPITIDEMPRHGRQLDDVRAALDWAFTPTGDATLAVALTLGAVPMWTHLSLMEECRWRVEQALASLGSSEDRDMRREMQLFTALGAALMFTKGAAPETRAAFAQALEIADSLDDTDYRSRALWGLWVDRMSDGAVRDAMRLAERFSLLASRSSDPIALAVGERTMGFALHFLGDQANARRHIERMLSGYVPALHERPINRFQFDPWLTARMRLAVILWLQGHPDQAIRTVESGFDEALSVNHAVTLCNALAQGACPIALLTGDLNAAERYVTILLDSAERSGLAFWQADAHCFRGVLLIRRGDIARGLDILRNAFDQFSSATSHTRYDAFLGELAEALGRVGDVPGGLATLDRALDRTERTEGRWCVAELLRIKGELVLMGGAPGAGAVADDHFRRSLEWARRQDVLSWELRAALSLARLRVRQDRQADARQILAPVYGRFTEGFETADLRAARALLETLPRHHTESER